MREIRLAISNSAVMWAQIRNVEAVWCWIPGLEDVMDGSHIMTALGHDGIAANIRVSSDESARAAGQLHELVPLAWLGKSLIAQRRAEVMAGIPEIGEAHG